MKSCERCTQRATWRVDQIVGNGGWGTRTSEYLCDDHMTALATTTDERFEAHEIVRRTNTPPRPVGEQPALPL